MCDEGLFHVTKRKDQENVLNCKWVVCIDVRKSYLHPKTTEATSLGNRNRSVK